MRITILIAALACSAVARPARAQTQTPRPRQTERFFVTVAAGGQLSKLTLDRNTTPTFYAEPGSVHQHFRMPASARFEVGGGIRFSRIDIGATVGMSRGDARLDVTAGIPHPFFFAQFRPAALSDPAHHAILDLNVDLTIRLFRWRTMSVSVGSGPTYTRLTQEIETALNISDVYPYDTVTIQSFAMTTVRGSGIGAHVLGSVTYPLRRRLLATGLVRYTSVKATTPMETGASDVRWPVGGAQVAGGLRIVF